MKHVRRLGASLQNRFNAMNAMKSTFPAGSRFHRLPLKERLEAVVVSIDKVVEDDREGSQVNYTFAEAD